MDIENLIKHYLIAYDGKLGPALKKVEKDIFNKVPKNKQNEYLNMIDICFLRMLENKVIRLVVYEEMSPDQKMDFDRDNEPIYKVLS